jgi:hypothetical protein
MTVSRIWWSRRAVAGSVQSAMRSPSTRQVAAPFAVVVAVEAEVEPGSEMEAGVGDHLDTEGADRSRRPTWRGAVPPGAGGWPDRRSARGSMSTKGS